MTTSVSIIIKNNVINVVTSTIYTQKYFLFTKKNLLKAKNDEKNKLKYYKSKYYSFNSIAKHKA